MPFENANCYGYAWKIDRNFSPGSLSPEREAIDLDGITDVHVAAEKVMKACKADGLKMEGGAAFDAIAVFINIYDGNELDFHFFRHGPNQWGHKQGNTGIVADNIADPVAGNLALVNSLDPNGHMIIGQHSCGMLYRPPEITQSMVENILDE